MKKFVKLKNKFGRKTLIAGAVSLLLIGQLAIGNTISWIEDVSQVKFSTQNDAQQTPVNISGMNWKSDAIMKKGEGLQSVNLGEYFNKSGDMHLSPCYSDGENFYFPVQQSVGKTVAFRAGTKDDANVNYLSATFRIQSAGANTAYWFEKSGEDHGTNFVTFKDQNVVTATDPQTFMPSEYKTAEDATALSQYLRFSVTVDGATIVYALNSSGEYYTLNAAGTAGELQTNGRSVEKYTYYQETLNDSAPEESYKDDNNKDKPNQGAGENLNGNTLFTVNKYDSSNKNTAKTVTVKIWLEYDPDHSTSDANLAAINMNLVSSWAKERRIYVKDATEKQIGYQAAKWLTSSVNVSDTSVTPTLRWALKDNPSKNWLLEKIDGTDYYFVDVPAVYNNEDVVLFRSANFTSNSYNQTKYGTTNYYYWDKWETKFPDTFHSEIFTVCTNDFGTWEVSPSKVYFLNSCNFETPRAYMWDVNFGFKNGIVENAAWPGVTLTKLKEEVSGSDYYTFYYNADYSNIIFSNGLAHDGNWEHQSEDITSVRNVQGQTFDMTSLMWYSATPGSHSNLPTYADSSTTYIDTSLATGHNDYWTHLNLCYGGKPSYSGDKTKFDGTNDNNLLCRFYSKYGASGSNSLQLVLHVNGKTYKGYENHDTLDASSNTPTLELYEENENNKKNLYITNVADHAIYSIYVTKTNSGYNVTLHKDT